MELIEEFYSQSREARPRVRRSEFDFWLHHLQCDFRYVAQFHACFTINSMELVTSTSHCYALFPVALITPISGSPVARNTETISCPQNCTAQGESSPRPKSLNHSQRTFESSNLIISCLPEVQDKGQISYTAWSLSF